MKIRFRDEFLAITGIGAGILSFISSSLMSCIVFCARYVDLQNAVYTRRGIFTKKSGNL